MKKKKKMKEATAVTSTDDEMSEEFSSYLQFSQLW
jgi:hypothetical protein